MKLPVLRCWYDHMSSVLPYAAILLEQLPPRLPHQTPIIRNRVGLCKATGISLNATAAVPRTCLDCLPSNQRTTFWSRLLSFSMMTRVNSNHHHRVCSRSPQRRHDWIFPRPSVCSSRRDTGHRLVITGDYVTHASTFHN